MMKNLIITKEGLLRLHGIIAEKTGGGAGVRDEGLLESALYSPYQSFGGEEVYKTVEEKGARLGYALVSNHAFIDGNKRIGVLAMLCYMRLNGRPVKCSDSELTRIGLGLASGEISYDELLDFIRAHV